MENLKSLADQLREEMGRPQGGKPGKTSKAPPSRTKKAPSDPAIVESIRAFDNSGHRTMVHIRLDERTVELLNRLKMATGIDITKVVAYGVHNLFETQPELKQTIKNYLQNLDL